MPIVGYTQGPVALDLLPFPFGVEFQTKLLKVIMLDAAGDLVMEHLKAEYFETPELRWMFAEIHTYWAKYHAVPTWLVVKQRSNTMDAKLRPTAQAQIAHMEQMLVPEEGWIRAQVLDWVQQNLFWKKHKEATALWNAGKRQEAMEHSRRGDEKILEVTWQKVDRGFFFEDLPQREARRTWRSIKTHAIPTGIAELDDAINGGLSPGQLGIWLAYSGGGKSTMLTNHGAMAARASRKHVLHFVLEGGRDQLEDRYEAWFADELFSTMRTGNMDPKIYGELFAEYQYLKGINGRPGLIITRGLVENWNYSILDIEMELKALRKEFAWKPDLIIVDYGDLLRGRDGPYRADWESQRDAFRDMHVLANRGYAVWTASQANFPDMKNFQEKEHLIQYDQIAGGKSKVHIADFVGSLNATTAERTTGDARLAVLKNRESEPNKTIHIKTNLAKMKLGTPDLGGPPNASVGKGPGAALGSEAYWPKNDPIPAPPPTVLKKGKGKK
jgi:replicative DNA helicase